MLSPNSQALEIEVIFGAITPTNPPTPAPPNDPTATEMFRLVRAAADYWETIVRDPGDLTITCTYDNRIPGIGKFDNDADDGMRVTEATLRFRSTPSSALATGWYFDATPHDHSEFAMAPTLFRDLPSDAVAATIMNGATPENLELSFSGTAIAGGPADNRFDFFTVAVHEMGHSLGMSTQFDPCGVPELDANNNIVFRNGRQSFLSGEIMDGQYDFNPAFLNGAVTAFLVDTQGGAHVSRGNPVAIRPLMNTNVGSRNRRLPSVADVLAIATCPQPDWAQIHLPRKDFLRGGTSDWNTAGNWTGAQLPESSDDIFIRLSTDGGIFPDSPFPVHLTDDVETGSLTVQRYSKVSTGANFLKVNRSINVSRNLNSTDFPTITVEAGGEVETDDFMLQGGILDLDGGSVDIGRALDASELGMGTSVIRGHGKIDVTERVTGTINASGTLFNEGLLIADGGNLVLQSTGVKTWDLDGDTEEGVVRATAGNLNFTGGTLTDPFSSEMNIGAGHSIRFAEDWEMDGENAELKFTGGSGTATLGGTGELLVERGTLSVEANARVTAPIALKQDAAIEVDDSKTLTFSRAAKFSGGQYSGAGRMIFNESLNIGLPTTIDTAMIDLDGTTGSTVVNLNSALKINSNRIDLNDSSFDGTLNMNTITGSIEVLGPSSWKMNGTMNVRGSRAFAFPMVRGSAVEISGVANISSRSVWTAPTTITGGIVMTSDDTDGLTLRGGPADQPNRIEGGSIGLSGKLSLTNEAWMTGWGLLASEVFAETGSGYRAEGGTLTISRAPRLEVGSTIGAAGAGSVIKINSDWTLAEGVSLELDGGDLSGGKITALGTFAGHGRVLSDGLVNRTEIAADGGVLVIDTGSAPDLDGPAIIRGNLKAELGNMTVADKPSDAFDGDAIVGAGRTMNFPGGFDLGNSGQIFLNGTEENSANFKGSDNKISGRVEVTELAEMDAQLITGSARISLASDAGLTLTSNTVVEALASISGPTNSSLLVPGLLVLRDQAAIDAPTILTGGIEIGIADSVGTASLTNPDFQNRTSLAMNIHGPDADLLQVVGSLRVDGALILEFDHPTAMAGDAWQLISGTDLGGRFDEVKVVGLASGLSPKVYVQQNGIFVKLVEELTYSEWVATQNFPGKSGKISEDPDGDGFVNGFEALAGSDPRDGGDTPLVTLRTIDLGGNIFPSLTLQRKAHTEITDLNLSFERTLDLNNWTTNQTGFEGQIFDLENCHESQTYFSKILVDDNSEQFLRFKLTQTP